jgi:hypothetical protein
MKTFLITASAALALAATAALAQQGATGVNGYTAAQRTAAEAAVKAAGYTPGAISYAQGGSIFINGEKGGEKFMITVTSDGKVVPGIATKPFAINPNAPPAPAGGRGGFGGGGGGFGGGGASGRW